MKKYTKLTALLLCLTMGCTLGLAGCTTPPENENPGGDNPPQKHEHTYAGTWSWDDKNHWHAATCEHTDQKKDVAAHDYGDDNVCDVCGNTKEEVVTPPPVEEKFEVSYREDYTPERFKDITYEITELAPGVNLVKHTMTLTKGAMNGKTSAVYTIEVDLKKANVVAGTKGNVADGFDFSHATPYRTALDWEAATGGQVYAAINADFFNQYDTHGACVNAFVKDGVIIKDGHNDNKDYNYKSSASDVPASAPMLFGVKGTTAQIAPMISVDGDPTSASVKEQFIKAKLTYGLNVGDTLYNLHLNESPSSTFISYRTSTEAVSQREGYAVKLDTTNGVTALKVLEVKKLSGRENIAAGEGYAWLQTMAKSGDIAKYLESLNVGDTVSFSVASPDGTWNGYETILGCRQALVVGNEIASTVTLENTNGAQSQDIPRTAVGIRNGKVVLIAVESMYYYNKAKAGDTHGMNLPELAEFAYYYGCSDAANFDGGGSTQLILRAKGETQAHVEIRSADTAGTGLHDTRPVLNAFLITSREN